MRKRDVIVREVGLRDGLQNVDIIVPTESKRAWITAEHRAGIPEIQVCSFVSPKLLPQFGDSDEVVAHAMGLPDWIVSAYVPNVQGAQRALARGIHQASHVVSASESHNQRNLRRSADESMDDFRRMDERNNGDLYIFRRIVELRNSREEWRRITLGGCVATAFGCTIEGSIDPDAVVRLVDEYIALGVDELMLADTVGFANPKQVERLFARIRSHVGDTVVSAHFHDTRGLGLANVHAALDAGVRSFDASLGGLGGCPFAPGATGNIVTEDLVFMLEAMGLRTGVDLDRLLEVRSVVEAALPDEPLHSAVAQAGLPRAFTPATRRQTIED